MPRLFDFVLNCVVYLYPSEAHAQQGKRVGGTGFLVRVPTGKRAYRTYVVTNAHIIEEGGTVVRLNTTEGEIDIIETSKSEWIPRLTKDKDDVAIRPIDLDPVFDTWSVSNEWFVTKDVARQFNIGIGDDVFMVGRYIDHEGTQKNLPAARFGNISMMPAEKVYQESRKHNQESYIVEMRSLQGFSGSPVFTYLVQPSVIRGEGVQPPPHMLNVYSGMPLLLGIDWGHFTFKLPVRDERKVVDVYSAMSGVVPPWKIQELIDSELEEFVKKSERPNAEESKTALDSADKKSPLLKRTLRRL